MSAVAIAAALALCAAGLARADDATRVELDAGKALSVCKAGLVLCPVSTAICDDPRVAVVENGPEGAELKAIAPGTTLCGIVGRDGAFRRVVRVTVKAPAAPRP